MRRDRPSPTVHHAGQQLQRHVAGWPGRALASALEALSGEEDQVPPLGSLPAAATLRQRSALLPVAGRERRDRGPEGRAAAGAVPARRRRRAHIPPCWRWQSGCSHECWEVLLLQPSGGRRRIGLEAHDARAFQLQDVVVDEQHAPPSGLSGEAFPTKAWKRPLADQVVNDACLAVETHGLPNDGRFEVRHQARCLQRVADRGLRALRQDPQDGPGLPQQAQPRLKHGGASPELRLLHRPRCPVPRCGRERAVEVEEDYGHAAKHLSEELAVRQRRAGREQGGVGDGALHRAPQRARQVQALGPPHVHAVVGPGPPLRRCRAALVLPLGAGGPQLHGGRT
mmetsp:Transcript_65040/g.190275  ORF Transcript_65040/g.190275 Transcript_65040/m.190275 type:complete len:340 (+) Transcript_65040:137-1156(+)